MDSQSRDEKAPKRDCYHGDKGLFLAKYKGFRNMTGGRHA